MITCFNAERGYVSGGVLNIFACLSHLTMDNASVLRRKKRVLLGAGKLDSSFRVGPMNHNTGHRYVGAVRKVIRHVLSVARTVNLPSSPRNFARAEVVLRRFKPDYT